MLPHLLLVFIRT